MMKQRPGTALTNGGTQLVRSFQTRHSTLTNFKYYDDTEVAVNPALKDLRLSRLHRPCCSNIAVIRMV